MGTHHPGHQVFLVIVIFVSSELKNPPSRKFRSIIQKFRGKVQEIREYMVPPWATGTPGVDDVMIIMIRDLENP